MKKRVFSFLLAAVLPFTMFPATVLASEDTDAVPADTEEPVTETAAEDLEEVSVPEGIETEAVSDRLASAEIMANDSGSCGSTANWQYNGSDYSLTITGTGALTQYSSTDAVPWYDYRTLIRKVVVSSGITDLGYRAFEGLTALTSVSLPTTLTAVGYRAFTNCTALTSITIPSSITNISNYAFSGCTKLADVTIHDGITRIGIESFYNCKALTTFTIPAGVTYIGSTAFMSSGLKTIHILCDAPSSGCVNMFQACTDLIAYFPEDSTGWTPVKRADCNGSVTWVHGDCGDTAYWMFEDGVLYIKGKGAMGNYTAPTLPYYHKRSNITSVVIQNGITATGQSAFDGFSKVTSVSIPSSVTTIGGYSFYGCSGLTSITIPESVTKIGNYAFVGCTGFTSFTIPAAVTSIGTGVFSKCTSLASFTVASGNTKFTVNNGVLFNADKTTIVAYPAAKSGTSYTIPSSVKTIYDFAFAASKLTSITIPSGVTAIKSYAFYLCTSLSTLSIPATVTSIGAGVFQNDSALNTVYFKGNAPSFHEKSFILSEFTAHYLPLASWTEDVRQDYQGTVSWVCDNSCGTNATWSLDASGVLTISGSGAMTDYANAGDPPWYAMINDITSIVVKNGITRVGNYAFFNARNVKKVTLADSVTSIGKTALEHMEALTSIKLPAKLTSLEGYAFSSCVKLASITFPKTVTSIAERAFGNCSSLKTMTFEGSAPSIASDAFNYVTATAYYPAGSTWTSSVMQDYGNGKITWVAIKPELDKTSISIPVFETEKLTVSGPYSSYTWSSSDEKTATVDKNGVVTAHKYGTATITAQVSGQSVSVTCKVQTLFWDVADPSAYYFKHVYWAAENGITNGYDLERFEPQTVCSREQMMTFLWRMAGKPEPKTTKNPFSDVIKGSYYYKAILWAVENGITNGYSSGPYAGKFGVGLDCTREQAMTFMWRMAGKPKPTTTSNPFSDVKKSDYFYKAVLWASENKIANGYSDGTYGVGISCLREHMVTFLSRYNSKIKS